MTDFHIHQWGRHYIIDAHSERAAAWFRNHWRTTAEPPRSRATKVAPFLSTILTFWEEYDTPPYTVTFAEGVEEHLRKTQGILEEIDDVGIDGNT